jgi:hypothetical protein
VIANCGGIHMSVKGDDLKSKESIGKTMGSGKLKARGAFFIGRLNFSNFTQQLAIYRA